MIPDDPEEAAKKRQAFKKAEHLREAKKAKETSPTTRSKTASATSSPKPPLKLKLKVGGTTSSTTGQAKTEVQKQSEKEKPKEKKAKRNRPVIDSDKEQGPVERPLARKSGSRERSADVNRHRRDRNCRRAACGGADDVGSDKSTHAGSTSSCDERGPSAASNGQPNGGDPWTCDGDGPHVRSTTSRGIPRDRTNRAHGRAAGKDQSVEGGSGGKGGSRAG